MLGALLLTAALGCAIRYYAEHPDRLGPDVQRWLIENLMYWVIFAAGVVCLCAAVALVVFIVG